MFLSAFPHDCSPILRGKDSLALSGAELDGYRFAKRALIVGFSPPLYAAIEEFVEAKKLLSGKPLLPAIEKYLADATAQHLKPISPGLARSAYPGEQGKTAFNPFRVESVFRRVGLIQSLQDSPTEAVLGRNCRVPHYCGEAEGGVAAAGAGVGASAGAGAPPGAGAPGFGMSTRTRWKVTPPSSSSFLV